ncbi:MAG: SPOR domain-containing protein [Fidelibacterota bacterium]|nr:MAG: SPOR domain-containing protein [Candidatus Neomarinimicrobiota bacterium]
MKRHLKVLAVLLILSWHGCQYLPWGKKESKPIFVGEPETIIVEPPEDAFDISYRWSILDLPDESLLVPDFSSYSNLFTFTPDVIGDYAFAVIVISYGEEVSDHEFYFTAMEDTSVVPKEEPIAAAPTTPATATEPETAPARQPEPSAQPAAPKPAKPAPASRVTRAKPPEKKYRSDVVKGHFTIQVSSWKTAKQAQKILQQVTDAGYDAYIQRVWLEDRNEVWWRVRIGDFTSVREARALLTEINAVYPGAWVDNVRKEDIDLQQ